MAKVWTWSKSDLHNLLETCERDGLLPLIEKYLPSGSLVLESGCGAARYVKFLSDRSRVMVGLEWSAETLRMVQETWTELNLVQGDVAQSPFPDNTFEGVLSLGVVEHWPEGPLAPLAEIHRTLKPGGVAIISVPVLNTVRRTKRRFWFTEIFGLPRALAVWLLRKRRPRLTRTVSQFKYAVYPAWGEFFEYRMTPVQFEAELVAHGFEVVEHHPLGEMDGLYHELNPLKAIVKFKGWAFHPRKAAVILNRFLSRYPYFHPHMQVAVVRKPA